MTRLAVYAATGVAACVFAYWLTRPEPPDEPWEAGWAPDHPPTTTQP